MKKIPILIDPVLNLDVLALKKAWEADPQTRELGELETQSSGQFSSGVELIWIPLVVSVTANLITEFIVKWAERESSTRPKPPELFVRVEKLPNGTEAIMVEPKEPTD